MQIINASHEQHQGNRLNIVPSILIPARCDSDGTYRGDKIDLTSSGRSQAKRMTNKTPTGRTVCNCMLIPLTLLQELSPDEAVDKFHALLHGCPPCTFWNETAEILNEILVQKRRTTKNRCVLRRRMKRRRIRRRRRRIRKRRKRRIRRRRRRRDF